MNRRHADFQAEAIHSKTTGYNAQSRQTPNQVSRAYADSVKLKTGEIARVSHTQKENPGTLAGASGAYEIGHLYKTKHYSNRAEKATALASAIADCDPADACEIMAAALSDLSIGMPQAPLFSIMDQASFWADMATQSELKAYTLACFTRMTPANRSGFLGYVRGAQ